MANILGSLIVDLKANVAEFLSGMSEAGRHAARTGREIEETFSRMGSVASSLLAPFGELGKQIGGTLGEIGDMMGRTMTSTAKLGGTFTAVGAGAPPGWVLPSWALSN